MTENEVIELLKNFVNWNRDDEWLKAEDMEELVNICSNALKEVQQYRKLGTIGFLTNIKRGYDKVLTNVRQCQNAWQQLPEQYEGDEKNMKKAYIIPYEAWYKNSVAGNPCICVGFYREGGGTEGEFEISWDEVGIRLQAYSDSWQVLRKMPELTELMAKISREKLKPTINEFAEMLNNIGFKDITQRERSKS